MKITGLALITLLFLTPLFACERNAIEGPRFCTVCPMDRHVFSHSRMQIVYSDGIKAGACSLHCAAAILRQTGGRKVASLLVADFNTKKLLDAAKAVWVVGGRKSGVMTAQAKWAFGTEQDARRFIEENGGRMSSFGQAMTYAQQELIHQAAEEMAVKKQIFSERM